MKKMNKVIECADGFTMSVQASETNYSMPRTDTGPYVEAEVGFPSERESLLMRYAEDSKQPTNTVYGYVPRQVIINVIAKHGGMISGELPEGFPLLMVKQ